MTRSELVDELAMLLGGRVAEEMIFGEITTGDQNDIERATKVARQMVCEYGMSERLGPLTLGQKQGEVFLGRDFASQPDYSDQIAFEIDQEIRRLVDDAYGEARRILTGQLQLLKEVAAALIEREPLEKDELLAIMEGREPEAAGSGREAPPAPAAAPEPGFGKRRRPSPVKGKPAIQTD